VARLTSSQVKATAAASPSLGPGFYIGTIKNFDEEKGWGFIDCAEAQKVYGRDVYVHAREFDEGIKLGNGDSVLFQMTMGLDGRPAATDVSPYSQCDESREASSGRERRSRPISRLISIVVVVAGIHSRPGVRSRLGSRSVQSLATDRSCLGRLVHLLPLAAL